MNFLNSRNEFWTWVFFPRLTILFLWIIHFRLEGINPFRSRLLILNPKRSMKRLKLVCQSESSTGVTVLSVCKYSHPLYLWKMSQEYSNFAFPPIKYFNLRKFACFSLNFLGGNTFLKNRRINWTARLAENNLTTLAIAKFNWPILFLTRVVRICLHFFKDLLRTVQKIYLLRKKPTVFM